MIAPRRRCEAEAETAPRPPTIMRRFGTWTWGNILEYLNRYDTSRMDVAMSDRDAREVWTESLRLCIRCCGFSVSWSEETVPFLHWLVRRGMQPEQIWLESLHDYLEDDVDQTLEQQAVQVADVAKLFVQIQELDRSQTVNLELLPPEPKPPVVFRNPALYWKMRNMKQQLIGMAYASFCRSPDCTCDKALWAHAQRCDLESCEVANCAVVRSAWQHYITCPKECLICAPTRRILRNRKRLCFMETTLCSEADKLVKDMMSETFPHVDVEFVMDDEESSGDDEEDEDEDEE